GLEATQGQQTEQQCLSLFGRQGEVHVEVDVVAVTCARADDCDGVFRARCLGSGKRVAHNRIREREGGQLSKDLDERVAGIGQTLYHRLQQPQVGDGVLLGLVNDVGGDISQVIQ